MILKNADIFDSEFAPRRADVRIEDGKITEIGENYPARLYRHTYPRLRGSGFLRRSDGYARNHVADSREFRRNFVLPRVDDSVI